VSSSDFDFSQYGGSAHSSDISAGNIGAADSSFSMGAADDGWSEPAVSGGANVAGPPFLWLSVAIGLATCGVVVGLLAAQVVAVAVLAWALSGPLAIGASAAFTFADTKQRANSIYGQRQLATYLYVTALVLALVGVVIASLHIADWAGRA